MKDRIRTFFQSTGAGSTGPAQSQRSDKWWSYTASYDAGPGSVRVDLALRAVAPLTDYPWLVVTGPTYTSEHRQGLPDTSDFEWLDALQGHTVAAVAMQSPCRYVGTFTHNFEQLHYIYVKNTVGISQALSDAYREFSPSIKNYTNIKQDNSWSDYLDFLYPNKETIDHYRLQL